MARAPQRLTIYDMMDQKGAFDSNPANPQSRDSDGRSLYEGPVEYPKMLYHPTGEMVETSPGEVIESPLGARVVGRKEELIHMIVNSEEEERVALEEGWHLHPLDSHKAAGRDIPQGPARAKRNLLAQTGGSAPNMIQELRDQLAAERAEKKEMFDMLKEMREQLNELREAKPSAPAATISVGQKAQKLP